MAALIHKGMGTYEPSGPINIPFVAFIPGGLSAGTEFIISGRTFPRCSGFSINLCKGPNLDQDCCLHFNPRLDNQVVVRNHKHGGNWGSEERSGGMPFSRDNNFSVTISVGHGGYEISVNHTRFCNFGHRLAKETVQYIFINGDLSVFSLQMHGGQSSTPPSYQPPAYPSYPSPAPAYPAIPSYTTSVGPFYNPPVPFTTPVPGRLNAGRIIYITGAAHPSPGRFTVNLACGPNDSYDYALHFDVRFSFGSDRNQTVRTHKQGGHYGTEERHQSHFPFFPNAPFDLMILAETGMYKIAVNNQHFTEFYHRILPIDRVTHLMVTGDVRLHHVRFQ